MPVVSFLYQQLQIALGGKRLPGRNFHRYHKQEVWAGGGKEMPFPRADGPGTHLLSRPAGCLSRALCRSLVAGTLSRCSWGDHVSARSFRLGLLLLSLRRRRRRLLLPAADCGNAPVSCESRSNPSFQYSFCTPSTVSAQQTALLRWP